ncbi:MAG TPA: IclR family transcriptional regulator, partial [Ktedonosporobacter sp.]|nr:IclR family transcriptional regulator [Ktedonosporobacter sp.]
SLDRLFSSTYTVHMVEQNVHSTEQPALESTDSVGAEGRGGEERNGSRNGAALLPAPMVERAFRLLDLLSLSEEGLTLSELARLLSMSKGSLHGLLKTLEHSGAVEQIDERQYVLGPKIYDLAQHSLKHAGLRRFALPAMHRLAQNIGETLFLGRIEPQGVRIIECVLPDHDQPSLHISAGRGTRVHLLAGATGRVILASWPLEQRTAFLRAHPLPRFTAHSITDPDQFLATVAEAERTGIGEDREEYLGGVNAVAAPITGPGGALVALLWVVGFSTHFHVEAMRAAGQQLREETIIISQSFRTSI